MAAEKVAPAKLAMPEKVAIPNMAMLEKVAPAKGASAEKVAPTEVWIAKSPGRSKVFCQISATKGSSIANAKNEGDALYQI